ncbi:MAG: flagellar biosynthesis protein FlhF [Oscillospiraceae bacterium]|nr:flagellar biosynthesis protein FlhF [Oscillospiraceae bacterium]
MRVRRYSAPTAQEAMHKVRMDLGDNALIVHTQKVRRKGLAGLFAKPMVEVIAAVDEDRPPKAQVRPRGAPAGAPARTGPAAPVRAAAAGGFDPRPVAQSGQAGQAGQAAQAAQADRADVASKVEGMEGLLSLIYAKVSEDGDRRYYKKYGNALVNHYYNTLLRSEVEESIIHDMLEKAERRIEESGDGADAASIVYAAMAEVVGEPETIALNEGRPTTVIFVGPTGVGKTTTLAKLAAKYYIEQHKEVGLITADTYRIAAVEQLRTYADILGMPVEVVYSPDEMGAAIRGYADKDVIMIDTAGRSHKDRSQFGEIKAFVDAAGADEVCLVIGANIGTSNCREIIKNYGFLGDYKLIFTKVDETPHIGSALNAKVMSGKGFAYFATGQSVPDDIEPAVTSKIIKMLLGSKEA